MLIKKSLAPEKQNQTVLNSSNVDQTMLGNLLQNLCQMLNENKDLYAIRALLRVIQLSQQNLVPFAATLGEVLQKFINDIVKGESDTSPNYAYILFEASALTLTYVKSDAQAFAAVEDKLAPALNEIIEKNVTDYMGYAFQIYATFVASTNELKPNYQLLCQSILGNLSNWSKEMKFLIPAMGTFVITIICKFPDYANQQIQSIKAIVQHLLSVEIRME